MDYKEKYDVIVVGGGHAGCEAAHAAATLGSKVLLISQNLETIARMSCNPAMGGIAKGQILREIDALGGMSAIVTDRSTIQFRMLNKSKGPAMWSPRAQCDRKLFEKEWRLTLEMNKNIDFYQDSVESVILDKEKAIGVKTKMGVRIKGKSVILCNGTFLNGLIHLGEKNYKGGRSGEPAAEGITKQLIDLGFTHGRMKTGTPPRLDGRTIDYSKTEEQKGDQEQGGFSYLEKYNIENQKSCYITYTSKEVHRVLQKGFEKSPMFTGRIQGLGPRYCPSIEDKIVRFADKPRHQLFIEPEGKETIEIYLNGFSTSLPENIQIEALRKIKGLEKVKLFRAGYAIEYDYFPPTQLKNTLETKIINKLFFCGQINGTTGYEEAACQGLIAGINAHQKVMRKDEFILTRSDAYIGVLIDDLITKGTEEPYRMFTSRAEYRLYLRADNADLRLSEKAIKINLLDNLRKKIFTDYKKEIKKLTEICKKISITPNEANKIGLKLSADGKKRNLLELIGFDNVNEKQILIQYPNIGKFSKRVFTQLKIQSKYEVHVKKQEASIISYKKDSKLKIPKNIDYTKIGGLSKECSDALGFAKPGDLAAAARIPGVTAAALTSVLLYTKKNKVKKVAG